jgi:hypothetical protein
MPNSLGTQGLGDGLAFVTALGVVLIDCQVALRKLTSQLNSPSSLRFWFVGGLCGGLAAACSHWATAQWLTDNVAQIKVGNPMRGLLIGLAVLTILRSKLFNAGKGDNPIGGEFLYNAARLWAVQGVWNKWSLKKKRFNTAELRQTFLADPLKEDRIVTQAKRLMSPSPDREKAFADEIANLQKTKPQLVGGGPLLDAYYEGLVNVLLDYCGTSLL